MITPAQWAENERREHAAQDGIAAVELYGDGATPSDLAEDLPAALALMEGVMLYAQLLETTLMIVRQTDPPALRKAACQSASMWRTRVRSNL